MNDDSPPRTYMGYAMLGYFVTLIAAFVIHFRYHPGGVTEIAFIAVPLMFLAFAVYEGRRARKYSGPMSAAMRRYKNRLIVMMLGYFVFLALAVWANDRYDMTGVLAWILAILPALPIIGVIWAIGRLIIEETDEYLRQVHIRGQLIATGFMLSVVTIWGFLEQFELVPHVVAYWAFVVWCGGLGISKIFEQPR